VRAATVIAEARAKMGAQESVASLASAHREADEVVWKVTLLEGELAIMRQAQDMAEARLLGLVDCRPPESGLPT
jgi:hypothetical protein